MNRLDPAVFRIPLVITLALCLAGSLLQARADSVRCGRKVVRDGDTQAELTARCGTPGRKDTGYETLRLPEGTRRVRVDRWYYKPGSRSLERIVLLYRGQVVGVRTGAR